MFKAAIMVVTSWYHDLRTALRSPDGWKLLGQILGGMALVWGVFVGVATYQSSHLLAVIERGERSYYQLLNDLGRESPRVRIGAIRRIPDVMLQQLPISHRLGIIDSLKLILGWEPKKAAVYHSDVQRLVHIELDSLNSSNPNWSLAEVESVIDVLEELGAEGWYAGKSRPHTEHPKDSLAWIWKTVPPTVEAYQNAATLFESVRLDGINLSQFDLAQADFKGASLKGANLSYSILDNAALQGASLHKADLSYASVRYGQLEDAKLQEAYLTSAIMEYCDLKHVDLRNAHLQEADLSHANMLGAVLTQANVRKARLQLANLQNTNFDLAYMVEVDFHGADLSFASLRSADLSNSNLTKADLSFAILSNTNLQGTDLNQADFLAADLSHANLRGVRNLNAVRDWLDANIAGVKGLSGNEIRHLMLQGAVVIPNPAKWRAYKEAGRPHSRWKEFAR